jgi:hypothetical protein
MTTGRESAENEESRKPSQDAADQDRANRITTSGGSDVSDKGDTPMTSASNNNAQGGAGSAGVGGGATNTGA